MIKLNLYVMWTYIFSVYIHHIVWLLPVVSVAKTYENMYCHMIPIKDLL